MRGNPIKLTKKEFPTEICQKAQKIRLMANNLQALNNREKHRFRIPIYPKNLRHFEAFQNWNLWMKSETTNR
jgi:hypothetical protein